MTDERKKFEEDLDDIIASDIDPDAGLAIIKSKCAELANKQRKATKKLAWWKSELSKMNRLIFPVEMHYRNEVDKTNRGLPSRERMTKEAQDWKVKDLVNSDKDRGTVGIYEKIELYKSNSETVECVVKNNKMIADRVENMLNAQINLDKQQIKHQG